MSTTTITVPKDPPVPPEQAKEAWLAERRTFIGGSDVYKLLNEKQYGQGCVRALAYEKLHIEPDYPEQDDDEVRQALFRRGNVMESIAAEFYAEDTGRKLRRPPMDENGLPKAKRHPEYPWAAVHADRIVLAGYGDVRETGSAEIKSRGMGPWLQMLRSGLFNGDNLQIQHAMFVNNHSWGPFITIGMIPDGTLPLKHFDVPRSEPIIDIIKQAGDKFAETVWVKGELPERPFAGDDERCKVCAWRMACRGEEIDAAAAAALKAEKSGKTPLVQISNNILSQALADRAVLKAQVRAITNPEPTKEFPDPGALELVEEVIERELGSTEAAMVEGYGKVYYKYQAGRTTAELGKMMEYLKDVSAPAGSLAAWMDGFLSTPVAEHIEEIDKPILAQIITVLKSVEVIPATVSLKYTKTGEPFRALRTYPLKAVAQSTRGGE